MKTLICLSLISLFSIAAKTRLSAQDRVFHDAYVVIPERFHTQPEFADLSDTQTRFVRSSEKFRIRYDELVALGFDQLRILFFKIPLSTSTNVSIVDLQKRSAEAFSKLPASRMAQLLTDPELRLRENLQPEGHMVNYSELQLAQYYADTLLLHQQQKFLKVLEFVGSQAFEPAPIERAFELLQLVRNDRTFGYASQAPRARWGYTLSQLVELLKFFPEDFDWQTNFKRLLISRIQFEMGLKSEKPSAEEVAEYQAGLQQEIEQSMISNRKPIDIARITYKNAGSIHSKLREGEYILIAADDLKYASLQLLASSSTSVMIILRSEAYYLAIILDPGLKVEDSLRRVFQRLKLLKLNLKKMKAVIVANDFPRTREKAFEVKRLLRHFQIGIDQIKWTSPIGPQLDDQNQIILRKDGLFQVSSESLQSQPLLRTPSKSPPLLRPHPKSIDFSFMLRDIRVSFPPSFSKVGREEVFEMSTQEIKALFNPTFDLLSSFPKEDATQLLTSLPYWMIADVLFQNFDHQHSDLFKHYIDRLRVDEPQKLEQIILYLHPADKPFSDNTTVYSLFAQIFGTMSEEETEDLLSRIDLGAGRYFQSYSNSLQEVFLSNRKEEPEEEEYENTEEQVKPSSSTDVKPENQNRFQPLRLEPKDISSSADYSYVPLLAPGSWVYSTAPVQPQQSPQIKLVLEPDSVFVSVSDFSKKKIGALHLMTDLSDIQTHQMIDQFIESLSENLGLDPEESDLQILIGDTSDPLDQTKTLSLVRIQKHFFLAGFTNLQTKEITIPSKRGWLGVLVNVSKNEMARLRKPRLFELRNVNKWFRMPPLHTHESTVPTIAEARKLNDQIYKQRIRGKCEHFLSKLKKKKA